MGLGKQNPDGSYDFTLHPNADCVRRADLVPDRDIAGTRTGHSNCPWWWLNRAQSEGARAYDRGVRGRDLRDLACTVMARVICRHRHVGILTAYEVDAFRYGWVKGVQHVKDTGGLPNLPAPGSPRFAEYCDAIGVDVPEAFMLAVRADPYSLLHEKD